MDTKKLNEIAEKLEKKYIPESAKGNEEAKEILALIQHYRVQQLNENDMYKHCDICEENTKHRVIHACTDCDPN